MVSVHSVVDFSFAAFPVRETPGYTSPINLGTLSQKCTDCGHVLINLRCKPESGDEGPWPGAYEKIRAKAERSSAIQMLRSSTVCGGSGGGEDGRQIVRTVQSTDWLLYASK